MAHVKDSQKDVFRNLVQIITIFLRDAVLPVPLDKLESGYPSRNQMPRFGCQASFGPEIDLHFRLVSAARTSPDVPTPPLIVAI